LKEQLPRNLFHDFNSGGFVVWKLSPGYPDYIDGRSVPFGGSLLLRNSSLLEEALDSAAWTSEADTRGIRTLLLSMDFEAGNALRSLGSYCDAKGGGLFSWMHLEQCLYGLRRKQPIWFIASKSIARRCSLRIRRLARQD